MMPPSVTFTVAEDELMDGIAANRPVLSGVPLCCPTWLRRGGCSPPSPTGAFGFYRDNRGRLDTEQ